MKYAPYSFSRLSEYQRCPRKFYFKYIERLPDLLQEAGRFGKIVHELISYALEKQTFNQAILARLSPAEANEAIDMLEKALQFKQNIPLLEEYGTEIQFAIKASGELTDFNDSNALLRGVIDYAILIEGIDRQIKMLVDWKTGHNPPDPLQLQIYMQAIRDDNVQGVFVMLRTGKIIIVDKDEKAKEKILRMIKTIEQDKEFEPKPGMHCSFCSYLSMCPLAKSIQEKDIPAIRTLEELDKAYKELSILQIKQKRWKEAIKQYLKAIEKPIDYKGLTYRIGYSQVHKVKPDKAAELFGKLLEEKPDALKIDNKRAFEAFPEYFDISYQEKLIVEGGEK